MSKTSHQFGDETCQAIVNAAGAELASLKVNGGIEVLWNAGPEWTRHSPVLFPIVGRLPEDRAVIDGMSYRMTQHGFARDRVFEWVESTIDGCVLELRSDAETQALFPFTFVLRLTYRVTNGELTLTYTIRNPDTATVLPASIGAHPAFNWPLQAGEAREGYVLRFSADETQPIRRVEGGLLLKETFPSPVQGNTLPLGYDLFAHDALIFNPVHSTSVWFGRSGAPGLRISWSGFPQLGIWTKRDAPFLCVEPWHGYATPLGFDGDFTTKPGLLHIAPGTEWSGSWSVRGADA